MRRKVFLFIFIVFGVSLFGSQKFEFTSDGNFNFSFGCESEFYASKGKKTAPNKKGGTNKKGSVNKKNVAPALSVNVKAAIGLVTVGGIFIAGGVGLLVFDLVYYFPLVEKYKASATNSATYLLYDLNYNINLALFITSLSVLGVGLLLTIISLPLFVSKKTALNFNIGKRDDLCAFLSFKF